MGQATVWQGREGAPGWAPGEESLARRPGLLEAMEGQVHYKLGVQETHLAILVACKEEEGVREG